MINRFLLITAIMSTLTQCTQSIEQHPNKTVINWHKGGSVLGVYNELQNYNKPLQISGLCGSACTLALSFPNTCVYPDARLMFHLPRYPNGKVDYDFYQTMYQMYPDNIKPVFEKTLDGKDYWYSGAEMHMNHNVPLCKNY
jgi:hypothetical protein